MTVKPQKSVSLKIEKKTRDILQKYLILARPKAGPSPCVKLLCLISVHPKTRVQIVRGWIAACRQRDKNFFGKQIFAMSKKCLVCRSVLLTYFSKYTIYRVLNKFKPRSRLADVLKSSRDSETHGHIGHFCL